MPNFLQKGCAVFFFSNNDVLFHACQYQEFLCCKNFAQLKGLHFKLLHFFFRVLRLGIFPNVYWPFSHSCLNFMFFNWFLNTGICIFLLICGSSLDITICSLLCKLQICFQFVIYLLTFFKVVLIPTSLNFFLISIWPSFSLSSFICQSF